MAPSASTNITSNDTQLLFDLATATNLNLLANVTPFTIGMAMVATLLLVSTAFGNALVCVAIARNKNLQNTTNFFLVSLAVADFLVALLVMPLGMLTLITGLFPLSRKCCIAFITLEMLLIYSSFLHMCTLSVDRYLSLRYPIKYGRNKKKRNLLIKICLIWMTSAIFASQPSIIYYLIDKTLITDDICSIQNRLFNVINSTITFYIPLPVMLAAQFLTRRILTKKSKVIKCLENPSSTATISTIESTMIAAVVRQTGERAVTSSNATSTDVMNRECVMVVKSGRNYQSERRASKVLNIIIFTFIVLWTPYLLYSFMAISCPNCVQDIPIPVLDFVFWLCYASSAANPVIYTIFNPKFRQTFAELLNFECM